MFHDLPALVPIYCLQTVRMTKFKSDGIWCLLVLIGIPPIIIGDAKHLVLWPFGFLFSLKGVRKMYLFQLTS